MIRHQAIETGDPRILNKLLAMNQAKADQVFNMMTHDLLEKGVTYFKPDYINSEGVPEMVRDDDGNPVGLQMVNPALPYFQKHLQIMNNTPYDSGTTHRQAEAEDEGKLLSRSHEEQERLEAALEAQQPALDRLVALISGNDE